MLWALFCFIIKWLFILAWRFFSGAHMNARVFNDSTWWHDASPRYKNRRNNYTWWRRKSRMKRAAWRNCIAWPVMFTTWAFYFYTESSLVVLGFLAPGLLIIGRNRMRRVFFNPLVIRGSDGSVTQHWILKPKWTRVLKKIRPLKTERKRPGLAMDSELQPGINVTDIPEDYEAAVRAELAEELDGMEGHIELKLLMSPDDFG